MPVSRHLLASRREAASAEYIRHVAGDVSDRTIGAILSTGATPKELELAAAFARGEGDVVGRQHYTLTGRVKRIFDILAQVEPTSHDAQ